MNVKSRTGPQPVATIAKPGWSRHLQPPETELTSHLKGRPERHLYQLYYITLARRHFPLEGYQGFQMTPGLHTPGPDIEWQLG